MARQMQHGKIARRRAGRKAKGYSRTGCPHAKKRLTTVQAEFHMRILLRQGSASFVKLPYLIIFMHFPVQIPSPFVSGNAPGARSGKRYSFMHKGTQKIAGK
ncbi:hypothetical protein BCBD1442_24720 [Brucella ceti]|nr:hypothetical protein BCBD1442_24720 [Brucella ceti]